MASRVASDVPFCPVRYREPRHVPHDEAVRVLEAAIRGANPDGEANSVLVGLALTCDDRTFVEQWCMRVGRESPDLWLRGLASLCVGSHLARRFGFVSPEAVTFVRELAGDSQVREVNSQVESALADLDAFYPGNRSAST